MKILSQNEALNVLLETKGRIFTALFTKKDGTTRQMNCRLGVKKDLKGTGHKFTPIDKGLLNVFDIQKGAYRFINLKTLKAFTFKGETIIVTE